MAVLAFTALFSTLNAVSASVLQGAGAIRTPVKALLVAIVLKALGNVVFDAPLGHRRRRAERGDRLCRCGGAESGAAAPQHRGALRAAAVRRQSHAGRGADGRLPRSAATAGHARYGGMARA